MFLSTVYGFAQFPQITQSMPIGDLVNVDDMEVLYRIK